MEKVIADDDVDDNDDSNDYYDNYKLYKEQLIENDFSGLQDKDYQSFDGNYYSTTLLMNYDCLIAFKF